MLFVTMCAFITTRKSNLPDILSTIYTSVDNRIQNLIPIQSAVEPWLRNKDNTNILSYLTLLLCVTFRFVSLFPHTTSGQQVTVSSTLLFSSCNKFIKTGTHATLWSEWIEYPSYISYIIFTNLHITKLTNTSFVNILYA